MSCTSRSEIRVVSWDRRTSLGRGTVTLTPILSRGARNCPFPLGEGGRRPGEGPLPDPSVTCNSSGTPTKSEIRHLESSRFFPGSESGRSWGDGARGLDDGGPAPGGGGRAWPSGGDDR